eukprot:5717349-Amphidinium_carterae.1
MAEQMRTTSSSSTRLHIANRVNPPSQSIEDSLLAVGPPRLASTRSTSTTMSLHCLQRSMASTCYLNPTNNYIKEKFR